MKNLTKTLTVLAVGLLSCGLFCQQAKAITGDVEFTGTASASGASGVGITTITFANPWFVVGTTGDYSVVPFGTSATFAGFSFTGTGTGATLIGTVTPLWTFTFGGNTYSFDLLALTSGTVVSGAMGFTGTGTVFINGGDATAATWALEGTSATGFTFALSNSTTSAAGGGVPDGGSAAALLGIALVGVEALRR